MKYKKKEFKLFSLTFVLGLLLVCFGIAKLNVLNYDLDLVNSGSFGLFFLIFGIFILIFSMEKALKNKKRYLNNKLNELNKELEFHKNNITEHLLLDENQLKELATNFQNENTELEIKIDEIINELNELKNNKN